MLTKYQLRDKANNLILADTSVFVCMEMAVKKVQTRFNSVQFILERAGTTLFITVQKVSTISLVPQDTGYIIIEDTALKR